MIEGLLFFLLGNFTLTLFVIGLIVSAVSLAKKPRPLAGPVVAEALFKWFIFFSIGIAYIYNALFHVFAHQMAARLIGWADSPFQLEVGFASLGFGLIGLLATWRSFDLRLAAVLGPACFLWGAAGVHVHSMIVDHNFAPGNAGVIFWSDILDPIVGFVLLWLQHKYEREGRSVAPRARALTVKAP
ncbi:MAG TPA: DUF6790 family protein [Sphingomicrobium sp.]